MSATTRLSYTNYNWTAMHEIKECSKSVHAPKTWHWLRSRVTPIRKKNAKIDKQLLKRRQRSPKAFYGHRSCSTVRRFAVFAWLNYRLHTAIWNVVGCISVWLQGPKQSKRLHVVVDSWFHEVLRQTKLQLPFVSLFCCYKVQNG